MADLLWSVLAGAAAGLAILCRRSSPGVRLRAAPDRGQRAGDRQRLAQAAAVAASALPLAIGLGWLAAPVAAALGFASWWVLGRLQAAGVVRRRELLEAELPQACDLLAVCLESGLPLRTAATELARVHDGAIGPVLAEVSATVSLGADEARAWADLAIAEPALADLGREVSRTLGSGLALAAALRSLGKEARRAGRAAAQVRARRVGVRSVLPLMLCFLPAFLLLGVVPIVGGVAGHLFG